MNAVLAGARPGEHKTPPCHAHDPELWFAEEQAEVVRAQSLCAGCPVRADCLAGAIERREPWGVWGGELFERGRIVARKRPRGRPRKDDPATAALAANQLASRLAELEEDLSVEFAVGAREDRVAVATIRPRGEVAA